MLLRGLENPSLGLLLWTPPSPEQKFIYLLLLNSFILGLMLPFLSLWTRLTPTWVQFYNNCSWAPSVFYSKKLSNAEKKYSAFNRELLAAYSCLRHFRFMLEGRDFTIFTDHKPLTCSGFLRPGPHVSSVISPTWRNSPAPWFTSLAWRM